MSLISLIAEQQLAVNQLVLLMELDDEMEDKFLYGELKKRRKAHIMYKKRRSEGAFITLFQTYLSNDEKLFQRYLRLPPNIFYSLLADIQDDIIVQPNNRHPQPITPEQQLCLILRLVKKSI